MRVLRTLLLVAAVIVIPGVAGLPGREPVTIHGQGQVFSIFFPIITTSATAAEWTQHAFNAQRTSFNPGSIPPPWRWKWAWNGPTASGGITPGKFRLPRNSQPVTGGGRVYIAAGSNGVYALNNANGAQVWNRNPSGSINSTPAYDPDTGALFVVSTSGTLYKLNAATGDTLAGFPASGSSNLPLPPAVAGDRVFFSMGDSVYAVNKYSMQPVWSYNAGSPVDTPPAYSASRNLVVVASRDLYVHGIRNSDGARVWRTKTAPHTPGDPGSSGGNNLAEVSRGWPVIAEQNGLVLIKLRIDWQSLWTWSPWPSTNAAMRSNLLSNPFEQALLALRLDNGTTAFIPNIGHGGFGDGNYMPMGPQPVVKRFSDGTEVAYVVMRGSPCLISSCDGRADSHLGEMMLNNATVPGYTAGDVRYVSTTYLPTDEQPYLSMAGDQIFAAHWEAGVAHIIGDRSAARGSSSNPIPVTNLPHIANSQDNDVCSAGFSTSHYCGRGLSNTRVWPAGFYIYWRQGAVYDRYWSEYAAWVISNGTIYFVSTDGAVVALEQGQPAGASLPVEADRLESMPAVVSPERVIDYTDAREYAGRTVTVDGLVREVFNNGKAVYLGYNVPHQGHFLVRILKQDWSSFDQPPEALYAPGQRIQVTGTITWYQGDPVIYVRDPAQIRIVEAEARR
ncbi:MAG: PQQ-binding-like beta-propeller repeat protein [Chloroflexi bacterium]|nr:PQQ-binding-like beta-propeller repeat protein [Chloroflexota bacterium]